MKKHSRVWIIDDSEMDNFLNKMILETTGFSEMVECFSNPLSALQILKEIGTKKDEERIPEIIFLDINMPLMTGFDFLDALNNLSLSSLERIRFFLISSSEDPEDMNRINNYPQIIKYLNKPLNKAELI
jgi:response regulator RpfG family c-di-GMP phosphodiesterase